MFKEISGKTQKDLCTRTFVIVSHSVRFAMSGCFSLPVFLVVATRLDP